jgi:hypothetical protein
MSLERLTNAQLLVRLEEGWFLPLVVRRRRLDEIFGHLDQLSGKCSDLVLLPVD